MRIRDWSSDVCSSDLQHQRRLALADQSAAPRLEEVGLEQRRIEPHRVIEEAERFAVAPEDIEREAFGGVSLAQPRRQRDRTLRGGQHVGGSNRGVVAAERGLADRKVFVWGKSVSVG